MALHVGVDAGGSHTRAAVVDDQGRILGVGTSGRGKVEGEADLAAAAIGQAVHRALAVAGTTWEQISSACFAVAGLNAPRDFALLRCALEPLGLASARLENDTLAAWAAGTGARPGAVAIGGTGHNVLAVDGDGRRCWLSDIEGVDRLIALPRAGWLVGWTALGLGLAAPQGSALQRGALESLGAANPAAAMARLEEAGYRPGLDGARMAQAAAAQGDPLAALVLQVAGVAIGATLVLALRRLGLETTACPVAHVGGLFQAPGVLKGFCDVVGGACPQVSIGPPLLPPVFGAALLAMDPSHPAPLEALAVNAATCHLP